MRNIYLRRIVCFVLAALLCLCFTACGKTECQHEWYLSNHVAATATSNGSNQYTCKKCGQTYSEVIPATGGNQTQPSQNTAAPKREYTLFDLKEYSKSQDIIDFVSYTTEVNDSAGYVHKNVYCVSGFEPGERYYRYELKGEYKNLSGKLYATLQHGNTTGWLEFYDGDRFLYRTPRVAGEKPDSVAFSVDLTGVNYLTVYFKAEGYGGTLWMILDPIIISN